MEPTLVGVVDLSKTFHDETLATCRVYESAFMADPTQTAVFVESECGEPVGAVSVYLEGRPLMPGFFWALEGELVTALTKAGLAAQEPGRATSGFNTYNLYKLAS